VSQFLSPLILEAANEDGGKWRVVEPFYYDSDVANRVITVPAGFLTDLASTPRLPIIYEVCGNIATKAAVVHDYLYTSGRESRAMADEVLHEAALLANVNEFRAWLMWAGVRLGGGSHYTATPAGSPTK
jgi:hypothetical protein